MKRTERYYTFHEGRITPVKKRFGREKYRLEVNDADIIFGAGDRFIELGENRYLYFGGEPRVAVKIALSPPVEVSRQEKSWRYRRDLTLEIMPEDATIPEDLAAYLRTNHFIQNSLA